MITLLHSLAEDIVQRTGAKTPGLLKTFCSERDIVSLSTLSKPIKIIRAM